MNYHNITTNDMLNGDGLRIVLWVAGCHHNCPGCHNVFTHDKESGIPFTHETEQELFDLLSEEHIAGVTFSGGDPLAPVNKNRIKQLARTIKSMYPEKTIWLYTGYRFEEIEDVEILDYVDVLVDGKYIKSKSLPSPKWCGSSNQRVINVKETLNQKKIILHQNS